MNNHPNPQNRKQTWAERLASHLFSLYRGASRFFVSFLFSIPTSICLAGSSFSVWTYFFLLGLFVSVPVHLFLERLRVKENKAIAIELAASVGAGALYMLLDHLGGSAWFDYLSIAFSGVLLSCVVASYALLMNRDNETALMPAMIEAVIVSLGIGFLAMAAISLCLSAFTELLFDVDSSFIISAVMFCLVFFPINAFLARTPMPNEKPVIGRSDQRLFSHLLLPFYLVMLAILYVYMMKILVTRQMPVGTMNWYASFALFFYLLLTMCVREDGSALCRSFRRYGGVALIPVIAIQIVGIVIRFNAYGLTSARFLSMILLAHGVAALLLTILHKPLRSVFIAGAISCIVFSCTPLNVIDVPIREQEARLKRILTENNMLQDGQIVVSTTPDSDVLQSIYSCCDYLSDAPYVTRSDFRKLAVPLGDKAFAALYGALPHEKRVNFKYTCNQFNDGFDVTGYTHVQEFELYGPSMTLSFRAPDGGERTANLTEYVETLRAQYGDRSTNLSLVYDLDDQTRFLISYISIDKVDDAINWAAVYGYILQR